MRHFLLTGAFGLALLIALFYYSGADQIAQSFSAIGWGLVIVILLRFAKVAGAAWAWSCLFPAAKRISPAIVYGLRLVREGVNTLLPVAQVGGEFVGARLAARNGLTIGEAGASVAVDLLSQAVTQAVFTIAGIAVLAFLGGASAMIRDVALTLLALVPGLIGFFAIQRFGGIGWVERQIAKLSERVEWLSLGKMTDLDANLKRLYRDRPALVGNAALHLVLWFFGALEIWIALKFMGEPVSAASALVIESLSLAIRSATFVMPASLGVQEGAMIAICAVFGFAAPVALALSLSKRAAELLVGGVGLVVWQVFERATRVLRRPEASAEAGPAGDSALDSLRPMV